MSTSRRFLSTFFFFFNQRIKRKAKVELRMIIWSEKKGLLSKLLRLRDKSDVIKGHIFVIFKEERWSCMLQATLGNADLHELYQPKNLNKAVKHVFYKGRSCFRCPLIKTL